MKKFITTLVLLTLITLKVLGQGSIITGTIIDGETNSPLPGVSIVLKGSGVMAMTDSNGKYEINVLEGDGILVFSMQGMLAQEMPVDNRSLIDVSMEAENPDNINALQTALGIRRSSENLTHKYQGLYGKDVSIDHGYNVLGSLSGKLTGIDIKTNNNLGGSTNMLIRGFKSFYGNNQPMLIVDGVPYDNTITNTLGQMICFRGYDYGIPTSDLNPDNIESVNIPVALIMAFPFTE